MSDKEHKKLLLVFRHSPYGSGLARAGVDLALACGAFEQPVSLLFCGQAALQLNTAQQGKSLGLRDIAKQLASLPLYDIGQVYVDTEASLRFGLTPADSPVPVIPVGVQEIRDLIEQHDHVISL